MLFVSRRGAGRGCLHWRSLKWRWIEQNERKIETRRDYSCKWKRNREREVSLTLELSLLARWVPHLKKAIDNNKRWKQKHTNFTWPSAQMRPQLLFCMHVFTIAHHTCLIWFAGLGPCTFLFLNNEKEDSHMETIENNGAFGYILTQTWQYYNGWRIDMIICNIISTGSAVHPEKDLSIWEHLILWAKYAFSRILTVEFCL